MPAKELTPRQLEVKALIDSGLKPSEAARQLGISANAVHQHINRIPGLAARRKSRRKATQSGARRVIAAAVAPTPPATPAPEPKPVDKYASPEELIVRELATDKTRLKEITGLHDALVKEEAALLARVERLDNGLKALRGAKLAPAKRVVAKRKPAATVSVTPAAAALTAVQSVPDEVA